MKIVDEKKNRKKIDHHKDITGKSILRKKTKEKAKTQEGTGHNK